MTAAAISATIVIGLGLISITAWHLRPLKDVGRDSGLDLFLEDYSVDELEALYELPAAQRDGAE